LLYNFSQAIYLYFRSAMRIWVYQVSVEVLQPLIFTTFPGFYLRNALVKALTVHCREPGRSTDQKVISCIGCPRIQRCIYHKLNLPVEVPEGRPVVMPFRLGVSNLITGKYESGLMSFELIVFGSANHYAGVFKDAFEAVGYTYGLGEQGQAGSFRVHGFEKVSETELMTLMERPARECNALQLHFRHLKLPDKRQHTNPHLPLEYLLQLTQSRLTDLMESYGGKSGLANAALTPAAIGQTEQFALCNYQYTGTGHGHWFLSGEVKYEGNLTPVVNLIEAGRHIGIGRFTSYGFGEYDIQIN
jgi:hypothetical protein